MKIDMNDCIKFLYINTLGRIGTVVTQKDTDNEYVIHIDGWTRVPDKPDYHLRVTIPDYQTWRMPKGGNNG